MRCLTFVSFVPFVFNLQQGLDLTVSHRRYIPADCRNSAQQIVWRLGARLPQRTRTHHRRQQHMRGRILAPVLHQFVGLAERERLDFAPSPTGGGDDVAEELRPVGDPAYSAAGLVSPDVASELRSFEASELLRSPDASSTRSRTSAKLFRSSIASSSSSAISG